MAMSIQSLKGAALGLTALALVGVSLACGGGSESQSQPAKSVIDAPTACLNPSDGLRSDWPAAIVPEGAEVCFSTHEALGLAAYDAAKPTLRELVDAHLASGAVENTGRMVGSRSIYRSGEVEFIVRGYVGENTDHAGIQTEVDFERCGVTDFEGLVSCAE